MTTNSAHRGKHWPVTSARNVGLLPLILAATTHLCAQVQEDLDAHTFRINGFWFYSNPSGSFHGTGSQGRFDLERDAHFESYTDGKAAVSKVA